MQGYDESKKLYEDCLRGDEEAAVAFLHNIAGEHGSALELGVGSGRIALPLAKLGVKVDGIDISPATVAQMQAKPQGDSVNVTIGNFVDFDVDGRYQLIYVVWNTFFNVATQQEQVRCFQNVASHLTQDGCFVIEAFVPSFLYRLQDNQYVKAESIEVDNVSLDILHHDPATQTLTENHVLLTEKGLSFTPVMQRYAWPYELDLMANLAGLVLHERVADWKHEPYSEKSAAHISVYCRQTASNV